MITQTYSFNNLSAHNLVPHLIQTLAATDIDTAFTAPWHLCWLNNAGHPVIGLLPKVAWVMHPIGPNITDSTAISKLTIKSEAALSSEPAMQLSSSNLQLTTTLRNNGKASNQQSATTYQQWADRLIIYANSHLPKSSAKTCETLHTSSLHTSKVEAQLDPTTAYHHGFMGFIGYDVSANHLSPHANLKMSQQPAAFMGHYDIYLTPDADNNWQLHTHIDTESHIVAMVERRLQTIDRTLKQTADQIESQSQPILGSGLILQPQWDYQAYAAAFIKTVDYLYKGDSYQINLTQKWDCQLNYKKLINKESIEEQLSEKKSAYSQLCSPPSGLVHYLSPLYQNTQAPYAGYLQLSYPPNHAYTSSDYPDNKETFELISCSPELFMVFTKDAQGQPHIVTKPIKGTRPRGTNQQEDTRLKNELKNSDKDRAENVMIVDLLRNDLGKYAKTGSVKVPELFAIETYSNVHHMVSTVTATLADNIHPLTVLFDSLPAGSITGTPKKRAVEIINELEGKARGAYCGTLGYMNFDGTGQWNVLIRTLQSTNNDKGINVNLWAGGGITVGSTCKAEYQECRDKVGNLLAVLAQKTN